MGGRALAAAWREACEKDPGLAADTGIDEPVFCLGNCALGPAAMVDDKLVGCADVERLKAAVDAAREAAL